MKLIIVCDKRFEGIERAIKEYIDQTNELDGIDVQCLTHVEYQQRLRAKESSCIIIDDPWKTEVITTDDFRNKILELYKGLHTDCMTMDDFRNQYLGTWNNDQFGRLLEAVENENTKEASLKRSAKGGLQHGPEQRGRRGKAKRW